MSIRRRRLSNVERLLTDEYQSYSDFFGPDIEPKTNLMWYGHEDGDVRTFLVWSSYGDVELLIERNRKEFPDLYLGL
jgi:hypothetical protein